MDKFNDLHDLDNQADKHNRLYSHIFNILEERYSNI